MTRRDAVKGLFGGVPAVGQQWEHGRTTRRKHANECLYRGPFLVPSYVAESVRANLGLVKTTAGHLASRYAEPFGTVWIGRCPIPDHGAVVGEIVRTPEGRFRVHWWSAATLGGSYRDAGELMARHTPDIALPPRIGGPIMPPLMPADPPSWKTAEEIMRESELAD